MANYHSINTCSRLEVCCYRLCAVATDGGQLLTMAALSHGFSVCVCVCVLCVCFVCVCVCVCVCVKITKIVYLILQWITVCF